MSTTKMFKSMPNFRRVTANGNDQNAENEHWPLFRSSKPDYLTEAEVQKYKSLGIRTIIDFRSVNEYKKSVGDKLLDANYPIYKIKFPMSYKYKPAEDVKMKKLNNLSAQAEGVDHGRHIFIDFFKMDYVLAIFRRAPWYIQLYSMIWLIVDLILNTNYQYFVSVFARQVLNPVGLGGQYVDFLLYSGSSIAAALKLLSKPENVPAMINCAHGKDRTGVVSALIQGCLGKDDEEIADDYAQSQVELEPIKDRVYEEIVIRYTFNEDFALCRREAILQVLSYIKSNYGGVPQYLESIGFSHAEQQMLRENLGSAQSLS